jgi:thiamine-monophosphate kinase
MKEFIFLNKILNTLSDTQYLGDDCAYIKDLNIVVTQDTLVEDIHFSLKYTNAYQLGYKSAAVNISDILASGAEPKYLSISLSLPNTTTEDFIEEFYKAIEDLAKNYNLKVVGGDITGSDKIVISICAIGSTKDRNISSRKNAKAGDIVIITGEHGSSACGLFLLQNGINDDEIISEHLMPKIDNRFSNEISKTTLNYSMMDTSDGLVDALFKIAINSNVTIDIDFEKIPYNKNIEKYNSNYKNWILYGGEDYKLVATVDKKILDTIPSNLYTKIGIVRTQQNVPLIINMDNKILEIKNLDNTFNHFKD